MDLTTVIGIVAGSILIVVSMAGGGNLGAFVDIPSIMVTLGGTISAILITYPIEKIKGVMTVAKKMLNAGNLDVTPWYSVVQEIATIARRDGLLALEERIPGIEDEFLKRGLQMALDGTRWYAARSC
ncbi:MAG: hypothetical protein HRT89_19140 [Lentisphaeria bacterium]|nr:hypothetical protein [Lentisphaeria bacterium]NQZ70174.1 hypothetical protein [Lentisphaeria bacterium]